MKPHPFPLAVNIGTDIVHLPRIARLVSRPNGYLTRFTRRILHEDEQADFRTRFQLPPGSDVPLESRLYPTHRRFHVPGAVAAAPGTGTGTGTGTAPGTRTKAATATATATGLNAGTGPSTGDTTGGGVLPGGIGSTSPAPGTTALSINTEMARWLAGRFAAKEAARKAAPGGAATVGWKDVVVTRGEDNEETSGRARGSSLGGGHGEGPDEQGPNANANATTTATGATAAETVVTEEIDVGEDAGDADAGDPLAVEMGGGRRWRRASRASRSKDSGRPNIVYLDPNGGPGRVAKLSISHDGEYVIATVLAAS